MAKKRGGQCKHWAEEARVWIWYREIKLCCDWSDYVLDYEFAWTDEGKASCSTDHRPRMFEWIRKSARKPAGQDKRWRSMTELVSAVDRHPLFKGTQTLYKSVLWDILQDQAPMPETIQMRIDRLLQTYGLLRVNYSENAAIAALTAKHGLGPIFDRCLRLSLRKMDRLSGMALVWLLYLQTEPVHNWPIRAVLEKIVDKQVDDFFGHYFPLDQHLNYYTNAINALLHTRLDMSKRETYGYGYLEVFGSWPIIPQELLASISENHLFHHFEL